MATQLPEWEDLISDDIQKKAGSCTPQGYRQQGLGINPKGISRGQVQATSSSISIIRVYGLKPVQTLGFSIE